MRLKTSLIKREKRKKQQEKYKNHECHFPNDFFLISFSLGLVVEHQAIE